MHIDGPVHLILLSVLAYFAWEDGRRKQISVVGIFVSVLLWWGLVGIKELALTKEIFLGIGLGGVLCVGCKIKSKQIGMGDGLVCIIIGAYVGQVILIKTLFFGLLLGGVWAAYLLLIKKRKASEEIPFLPLVFVAFFIQFW